MFFFLYFVFVFEIEKNTTKLYFFNVQKKISGVLFVCMLCVFVLLNYRFPHSEMATLDECDIAYCVNEYTSGGVRSYMFCMFWMYRLVGECLASIMCSALLFFFCSLCCSCCGLFCINIKCFFYYFRCNVVVFLLLLLYCELVWECGF